MWDSELTARIARITHLLNLTNPHGNPSRQLAIPHGLPPRAAPQQLDRLSPNIRTPTLGRLILEIRRLDRAEMPGGMRGVNRRFLIPCLLQLDRRSSRL